MLVSRQVIRFSLLLGDTVGVRGAVVQFGGCLVVLVMRSVVITSGHIKYSLSLASLSPFALCSAGAMNP
jgi:hypothetical protein